MPLNTSLSTSPDGLLPFSPSFSTPFIVPESCISLPPPLSPPTNAMSEALKSPTALLRKLSRGTQVGRRVSNASSHRDQSAGPVVVRRRSDSNKLLPDSSHDVSDFELDSHEDDALSFIESQTRPRAPSQSLRPRTSVASGLSGDFRSSVLPDFLSIGTTMMKITKRKTKTIILRLDVDAGKITWDMNRSSKQVYIDDILSILTGVEAKEYREAAHQPKEVEEQWFSIFHSDPDTKRKESKRLDFMAPDKRTRIAWVQWIDTVQRLRIQTITNIAKGCETTLTDLWRKETRSLNHGASFEDAVIDFSSVKSLCRKLNIYCPDNILRKKFQSADHEHKGALDYNQFKELMKKLRKRGDIKHIYKTLVKHHKELTLDRFLSFLSDTQGIDVDSDRSRWVQMFESYCGRCREDEIAEEELPTTINFAAFQDMMLEPCVTEAINSKRTNKILDRPLNEYFISSSHNTYLVGKQFLDSVDTDMYKLALNAGCRSVEIDCWDGSDGKPIVKHGHARTGEVYFSACIDAINEHAFRFSQYPLVISLEVHCNPAQQGLMVDIMKTTFGDKLVTEFITPESKELPSPEALKGKILVKVKASTEELKRMNEDSDTVRSPISPSGPRPIDIRIPTKTYPHPLRSLHATSPPEDDWNPSTSKDSLSLTIITPISPSSSAEDSDVVIEKGRKKMTSDIIQALGDLGLYCKGLPYTHFSSKEAKSFNHIYSFSESTMNQRCKGRDAKSALEKHNSLYLMRVYPKKSRLMSSNFNPLLYWRRGTQMCAMNIQTYDNGMKMNNAMFATGDDSQGYVLKPSYLRRSIFSSGELQKFQRPSKKHLLITIDVISAQRLSVLNNMDPKIPIYPFVELEIYYPEGLDRTQDDKQSFIQGSPVPSISGQPLKSRTGVADNGYDPTFHAPLTASVHTKYPDLVFLTFKVYNSSDPVLHIQQGPPLAEYSVKLNNLQQGYRHIPLNDAQGARFYNSTLFCRVDKPEIMESNFEYTVETPLSASVTEGRAGGMLKRFMSRTPSLRKNNLKENRDSQPGMVSAKTFPPTSSGTTSSAKRVDSASSSLHEGKIRK
jgi:phosphatidylinositol phospholipase C delta